MSTQLLSSGQAPRFLTAPFYQIGRGADCDILLSEDDGGVSRHHARLERDDAGDWWISDSSTNGTRVNGERIATKRQLHHGDSIGIGSAQFTLSVAETLAARPVLPFAEAAPRPAPVQTPIAPIYEAPIVLPVATPAPVPVEPARPVAPAFQAPPQVVTPPVALPPVAPPVATPIVSVGVASIETVTPQFSSTVAMPESAPFDEDLFSPSVAPPPQIEKAPAPVELYKPPIAPVEVYTPPVAPAPSPPVAVPASPPPSVAPQQYPQPSVAPQQYPQQPMAPQQYPQQQMAPQQYPQQQMAPYPPTAIRKSSGLALLLSFFFLGGGQFYNGQIGKGFGFLCGGMTLGVMAFLLGWIPVIGWFIWLLLFGNYIFNLIDAYNSAERINLQMAQQQFNQQQLNSQNYNNQLR